MTEIDKAITAALFAFLASQVTFVAAYVFESGFAAYIAIIGLFGSAFAIQCLVAYGSTIKPKRHPSDRRDQPRDQKA